ncbi:dTDP-4-dehydrorhamnose reductase [Pseudoxanthomonas sp. 3HH-4]|uniref:dTDP-4-dehydrorhamnose reductase n=1 Tax=Pseudoxanthomonas sp. 3HH-4 TaxID=1690214 RepID=UPI00115469EB|nr:dTDP-4-dehydrorhamnose reductase [Pseudoxanthomonas sp. 3HH-4]TQM17677.1 dTDP-4-dehydrorhamnose reductase [Pseudoxanthomonas sp. 3HH-4]
MTFLLLGANGQVGNELRRSLAAMGEVVPTTRCGELPDGGRCEIADFDRPDTLVELVERIRPTVVINAAAYTAVDKAEDDIEAAFRANAEAPGVLARACKDRGIPFVHYSTDYVFDGWGIRPYREDDATSPLGVYGASKLAGEEAVREAGGHHLILRTAWVYGQHGHNFLRTMLRVGAERDELRMVADQIGTPTPASLIADVTAELLRKQVPVSGTFHLTPRGETSWHGFAEAIFDEAVARGLLARAPRVLAITTADYPTRAQRPSYSPLDIGKLEQQLGHPLADWRTGLQQVLGG